MTDQPSAPQDLHDPRRLRALAHPLRAQLLMEISALGHGRAADLAAVTGSPANQVSFHLRELAKHGFLVEAPELARDRRDRVWKPASPAGTRFESSELLQQPGGEAAYEAFRSNAAQWQHALVDAAGRVAGRTDELVATTDTAARLTKAEAQQMADEISELLYRWTEHGRREHAPDEPGVKTYVTLAITQPQLQQAPNDDDV